MENKSIQTKNRVAASVAKPVLLNWIHGSFHKCLRAAQNAWLGRSLLTSGQAHFRCF